MKKHVTLSKKNAEEKYFVAFDFYGKDAIPFKKLVEVEEIIFKNLKAFLKGKTKEDYVFHLIDVSIYMIFNVL